MAVIYKLEEDPTIFINPTYYSNRFVYRMAYVKGSNNRIIIRNIDLRKDKLTVHGTEIKEPMLQRLHGSLTFDQKQGNIYVNCDGACYFFLPGKGLCRPIHNVVFDWSPFGVVVPDSVNESLRKELKTKDNAIEEAKKEVEELREQVLKYVKIEKDKELELKKVNEKLSLVDFELESTKLELDSSKKNVEELEHQLSLKMKANEDFVVKVRNLQDELSSMNSELSLTKTELESTKRLLESSEKEVQELKNEYCSYKEENHDMGNKIRELSDDINLIDAEVRSSNRKIEEVMVSMLWNELGLCQQLDQPGLLQSTSMDVSPISDETNKSPVFIKIEDVEENV